LVTILDLGLQPDPDSLLGPPDFESASEAPVELAICPMCGLVQLLGPRPVGPRPPHGHAMPLPSGDPWLPLIGRSIRADRPIIWDVDGSSGLSVAALTTAECVISGLSPDTATGVDLVLVGHALAHVDDLDGLVGQIENALASRGLVAIDFHHVLGLARGQFDVVSHAHRSYLSLHSVELALDRHGLGVIAVQRISEYGGTVRVLAARQSARLVVHEGSFNPARIRTLEQKAQVARISTYEGLEQRVHAVCADLITFLDGARRDSRTVVGYGAASRGTTLINIAGIGVDLLPVVVDRAPAKQGLLLPRARVPIRDPSEIDNVAPDDILILPWPMADRIIEQLATARGRGARFVVAVPKMAVLQ
jgi:hypothetical protein